MLQSNEDDLRGRGSQLDAQSENNRLAKRRRKKSEDYTSYHNTSAPAHSGSEVTIISRKKCQHLWVRTQTQPKGECRNCGYHVPHYGSILDTGTVKAFIKVVYIDESRKAKPVPHDAIVKDNPREDEIANDEDSEHPRY